MILTPAVSQNGNVQVPVSFQQAELNLDNIITLDVETCHVDEKLLVEEIERYRPPSNAKDEEKSREKYAEKVREKDALLDSAPIGCVAIKTSRMLRVFNGVDNSPYKLSHAEVISCGNEAKMLYTMRKHLNEMTSPETGLNGFNIYGFDLPKLRIGYIRNRLILPEILKPRLHPEDKKQLVLDMMQVFLKYFTSDQRGKPMISLREVAYRFKLPNYKDLIDGSMIPDLIAKGEIRKVLNYNSADVICEEVLLKLALSMSSKME